MTVNGSIKAVAGFQRIGIQTFRRIGQASVALLICCSLTANASGPVPGRTWPNASTPEAVGWSSEKLKLADEFARTLRTDAYLVVEGGVVVHEYGSTSRATNVHSIRKSILSLLIGVYVDRGAIALDRSMAALDINDRDSLSDSERQATIQHLLQARFGIYHPAAYETASMAARRPARGSHAPGTNFYYNNWDFNALATIFRKLSKKTVFESLRDDLAAPLQFEHFSYSFDTKFHLEADSEHPAYLMRVSARDMARIGLLVARKGMWGDRRIVSEQWIEQSLRSYSDVGGGGTGFGYLWWVGLNGRRFQVDFPGQVVSAQGSRGQYIVVDVARGIVVVHKVNTESDRSRSVSGRDFGQLLKRIMDAKP